jgi:GNAT superfamily N-acetyltransferase
VSRPVADVLTVERVPADSAGAVELIQALDADLGRRYPGAVVQGLRPGDARDPRVTFFVARIGDRPAGCAALRELDRAAGEIKRMFVREEYRGRGIARRLIDAVEARGRELGYRALRLETGAGQPEAIGLYTSAGYAAIPPFGEYAGNPYSRCFEKGL